MLIFIEYSVFAILSLKIYPDGIDQYSNCHQIIVAPFGERNLAGSSPEKGEQSLEY